MVLSGQSVGFGGPQGNLRPGADSDIDNLPESVDDENDRDFDGAISGDFALRVGAKRKLLDSHEECRTRNEWFRRMSLRRL